MKSTLSMMSVLFLILGLGACGKKSDKVQTHRLEKDSSLKFVNEKNLPLHTIPDNFDKRIRNASYPIDLVLYKDHKFYYDLPNLGDGTGTWEYKDGLIELKTTREILGMNVNMEIEVLAADKSAKQVAIRFYDRFGEKKLKMSNFNID